MKETALAIFIGLLTVFYTIGAVAGYIPKEQRIDAVNLILILLAAIFITILLRPEVFGRLKILEVQGFKLELLEKVKERQDLQENQIDAINLILPLLLPPKERTHLLNLANQTTAGYTGNNAMRTEIRRLRSIGLVKMKPGKTVGEMKDNLNFNLAEFIELTTNGKQWVKLLEEIDKGDSADS